MVRSEPPAWLFIRPAEELAADISCFRVTCEDLCGGVEGIVFFPVARVGVCKRGGDTPAVVMLREGLEKTGDFRLQLTCLGSGGSEGIDDPLANLGSIALGKCLLEILQGVGTLAEAVVVVAHEQVNPVAEIRLEWRILGE